MLISESVDLVEVHLIGGKQVFHQLSLCLKRKKKSLMLIVKGLVKVHYLTMLYNSMRLMSVLTIVLIGAEPILL